MWKWCENKMSFIKNKILKNMRFRALAFVIFLSIVPLLAMDVTLMNIARKVMVQQKMDRLQGQCNILRNNLVTYSYLDVLDGDDIEMVAINAGLSQLSSMYDGRILIINNDFKIVNDTYQMDGGKICISNNVIKCFKGENVSKYSKDENYIELTLPITKSNSNDINGVMLVNFSAMDIDEAMSGLRTRAGIIELAIFVLVVVLSSMWSKSLVRPLRQIENSIEKISDGYSNEKLMLDEYVETEKIGEAFNNMLERIRKSDETRQEFVSNVSHELKTPITSIKVLADSLLMQEDVPPELYKEFLSDIAQEITRESDIITDLLTMVKLEKKTEELNIAQVNINELVELILKRLRPLAARQNIELVFESFRPVIAEIDEVKITSAISNLVENAIKYNVMDGWVRVSLNADHKYFYLKVSDSGVGIPEDAQDKVFERFYRVDKTRSRETGGTGLGLAITKNIIVMHQGAIRVYSKEGEGTTFSVRIPLTYIAGQTVKK